MIAELVDRLRYGDRNALARLISIASRGERLGEMQALLARRASEGGSDASPLPSLARRAKRVIAFTGSGGVGKSTLIGKLISLARADDHKVAVLACDPESPLSGGALLGDRFRMGSPTDDGVFIRSLVAHSGRGALADHLDVIIQLLETFGFDLIFLETVGAGQGDVAVRQLADVVVLLLQPESGDDVQWEKAGILECADIVVVHKADLPTAEQTAAQVRASLDLSASSNVPVLRVSTKANQGHAELWQAIAKLPLRRKQASGVNTLLQAAIEELTRRFQQAAQSRDPRLSTLVENWQRGEIDIVQAVQEVLHLTKERASS